MPQIMESDAPSPIRLVNRRNASVNADGSLGEPSECLNAMSSSTSDLPNRAASYTCFSWCTRKTRHEAGDRAMVRRPLAVLGSWTMKISGVKPLEGLNHSKARQD